MLEGFFDKWDELEATVTAKRLRSVSATTAQVTLLSLRPRRWHRFFSAASGERRRPAEATQFVFASSISMSCDWPRFQDFGPAIESPALDDGICSGGTSAPPQTSGPSPAFSAKISHRMSEEYDR